MKTRTLISTAFLVVFFTLCITGTSQARSKYKDLKALRGFLSEQSKLYTTYNMRQDYGAISSVNYHVYPILPAGTEVVKVIVFPDEGVKWTYNLKYETKESQETYTHQGDGSKEYVRFVTADGEEYSFKYHWNHNKESTIWSFALEMFSDKSAEELYAEMDEETVAAIKAGEVLNGMTMDEVVISLGIPFNGVTADAENNHTWHYFTTRKKKKKYCFDEDKLAIGCGTEVLKKNTNSGKKKRAASPAGKKKKKQQAALGSIEEKMESLKRMFDKGLINEEEYSSKKKELLDNM